jgi:hypothetical protein
VSGAPGRLPALREPAFRSLFFGQALSRLGDRIAPVALAFGVLGIGGSAADLGLVIGAGTVPFALFALAAGVWADRLPRQWIMFASEVGRGLAQAAVAVLLLTGRAEIWHLAALSAVYGVFEAGFRPAAGGLIPQIVESEHLQQANALIGLAMNFGTILGPVAAGLLIAASGPGEAIAIDAATFAVSAAFLLALRAPRPTRGTDPGGIGFWAELAGGIAEVRKRRWMWSFMPVMGAYHLIALPGVLALGPVIANRDLGGATAWGIITSAFGIGTIIGNGIALRVQPSRPMFVATVATAVASTQPIIIALGGSTPVIAGLELLAGIAVSFAFGQWETTLGREIPQHALARVTSLDYFSSAGVMPLGFALVGPVAALAGAVPTMVVSGLVVVVLSAAAATVPDIRQLRRGPAAAQESMAS